MNRKRLLEVMKASLAWMERAELSLGWEFGQCYSREEYEAQDAWPVEIKDMRVAVQALENGNE